MSEQPPDETPHLNVYPEVASAAGSAPDESPPDEPGSGSED